MLEKHSAHHEPALDAISIVVLAKADWYARDVGLFEINEAFPCVAMAAMRDAYLTTILNWCGASCVDSKQWPNAHAYYQRILPRPSIEHACGEELTLYKAEQMHRAS